MWESLQPCIYISKPPDWLCLFVYRFKELETNLHLQLDQDGNIRIINCLP